MRVTREELRGLVDENDRWHRGMSEHPTASISDDLFDRILADLHALAASEDGQGELGL
jgi:hypothetical protein